MRNDEQARLRLSIKPAAGAENHQKPKRAVLNEVPMPRTVPTTSRMNSTVPPAYVSSAGREIATATRSPLGATARDTRSTAEPGARAWSSMPGRYSSWGA